MCKSLLNVDILEMNRSVAFNGGPEGGKWNLGFAYFFTSENGIWESQTKNETWTGVWTKNRLGNGVWAKCGLGNEIYSAPPAPPPLPDPLQWLRHNLV